MTIVKKKKRKTEINQKKMFFENKPRKMDLEKEKGSKHESAVLGVRRGTQLSYDRDFLNHGNI